MYGMVNRAIQDMVESSHGSEAWERILERADVDIDVFVSSQGYPDQLTYSLLHAASEELNVPAEKILEAFGVHWIVNTAQQGYGDMMASGGSNLREFLINLPNFHARLSMIFPHLAPPEFACSDLEEKSIRMHYRSGRAGLAPFVRGLFLGLGHLFDTSVTVEHPVAKSDGADHDEFVVRWS
jgi:hypothetical protein